MDGSINRVNFTISAVKIVEIRVDDKISGGYRKPIEIGWLVIRWGLLRDDKLINVGNLLDFIWSARFLTADVKNGGKE